MDNALAYATSKYPDRNFEVRGAIISNTDLGLNGNRQKKAAAGTIYGSFECINGQYYIFYHRSTHNTEYSRQACAEPIEILPDGKSALYLRYRGSGKCDLLTIGFSE